MTDEKTEGVHPGQEGQWEFEPILQLRKEKAGDSPILKILEDKLQSIDPAEVPSSSDLSDWEATLTEPAQHREEHFRYLVHAVAAEGSIENLLQKQFVVGEMKRDPTLRWNNVNLLREPGRIAEKPIISASLIDPGHRSTWQQGGYILKVPLDNILKTGCRDVGTWFPQGEDTQKALYQERDRKSLADPDTLLAATNPFRYNEVVVAGTGRIGKRVEISGVFVKVFPDGELVPEAAIARQLQSIAYQRSLPFLRIQEPYLAYQDGFNVVDERCFAVNSGGRRYVFSLDKARYDVYTFGGKRYHAMSPLERTEAISLVRHYLSQKPDERLQALVAEAEQVSDQTLEEKVEAERQWKQSERIKPFRPSLGEPNIFGYSIKPQLFEIP